MNKSDTTFADIDTYIKEFPESTQKILKEFRALIHEEAPDAVEAMSYGMPTFKLHGKNLVHFAAWEKHIGFYPTPSGTEAFQNEIAIYKGGKGSIQLPLDKPMPMDLVKKIVRFRVEELSKKR